MNNTNDPHRFWPEGGDTDTKAKLVESPNQAPLSPSGESGAWSAEDLQPAKVESIEGGAREARADTIPPTDSTPVPESQKEEMTPEVEQSEPEEGAYRAPGMPEGAPQHIPDTVKVGSELPPSAAIKQEEESVHSSAPGWNPSEEDEVGVVHTDAKGVKQTSSAVFVFIFFAVIALVVLGIFLYRYLNLTLGIV